jgi:hypothetical protein
MTQYGEVFYVNFKKEIRLAGNLNISQGSTNC